MNYELLQAAIEKSLLYFQRVPADRSFPLGDIQIPASLLKETLALFLEHMTNGSLDPVTLAKSFDLYGLRPPRKKVQRWSQDITNRFWAGIWFRMTSFVIPYTVCRRICSR
ncbi:MAG: hypothetical protein M0C28_05985 [Candidatus Moduliflexus flocculans]|nr:hypothetical protein [Candidatus Moduliflexus flocculans]